MKILFIGHDAFRAGAELLLLQFLQWIKTKRKDIEFEILLGDGGALLDDYAEVGRVHIFAEFKNTGRISRKIKRKLFFRSLHKKNFDLIYCNSIVNGAILNDLKILKIPIITHVHELDYWINKTGEWNLECVKSTTKRYIVASEAVRNCLVKNYSFDNRFIDTVNEFTLFDKLGLEKQSLKSKLNLPNEAIIVGASGAEIWRKGKDLFIPLAIDILARKINKNIHFVWIGGDPNYELKNDLEKSGASDRIHFISHLPNANQYFHEFTVFSMLSRDDPFPVVNLEAAGLGVPIVCFENSGGTPELISEGCGFVVPYANIHAFADKVCLLIEDTNLRNNISKKSIEIIRTKYDIDIIGNKIIDVINNVLKN